MKVNELPESKRFWGNIIDEMRIREGLVYDKYTGGVTGFTMLSDINDEISALEKQCETECQLPRWLHMLTIT